MNLTVSELSPPDHLVRLSQFIARLSAKTHTRSALLILCFAFLHIKIALEMKRSRYFGDDTARSRDAS